MNAVRLPTSPALPEHSTDATGVVTGNADIAQPDDWKPWSGPKESAPLPGHEHAEPKIWPWLTERRAFALVFAIGTGVAAARLGGAM